MGDSTLIRVHVRTRRYLLHGMFNVYFIIYLLYLEGIYIFISGTTYNYTLHTL